jgi:uncharacterized membrane protein YqaE (UPF0057 family)
MKKLSLLMTILSCSVLLLSSCSKIGSISVNKRHYRGGYNIDIGSDNTVAASHRRVKTVSPINITEVNPEAASSTFDIAEERNSVSTEKATAATEPEISPKQIEKKKHNAKASNSIFYVSKQSIATVRQIVKAEKLKKQMASMPDVNALSNSSSSNTPMWLLIVLCILLPPLAVGLKFGIGNEFWISILLTLLFWIPGVIYALIKVTQ